MEINYFWAQLPPAIDTERCQAPVDSARFILAWQMQFYKHAFRDLREQRDAPQAGSHAVRLLPTSWHPWNDRFLPSLFRLHFPSFPLFVVLRTEHNSLRMPVEGFTTEAPSIPNILHTFYTEMGSHGQTRLELCLLSKLTWTCDFPALFSQGAWVICVEFQDQPFPPPLSLFTLPPFLLLILIKEVKHFSH